MSSSSNPVVLITGAASGIGEATAKLYAKSNYNVVLADRTIPAGEALTKAFIDQGHQAAFVHLDIADEASVKASVDFAIKTFGKIDCAVNCAGIGGPSLPVQEIPADKWQQVIDIDLTGTFYFTKALVNYWLTQERRLIRDDADIGLAPVTQRGALVNIASINALYASKKMGAYVAAKHGVAGISKSFAYELADDGIRVNTVNPGCVLTPIMNAPGFNFDDVKAMYLKEQAMQRFAHPGEIANAIFFLNSDEASFVTGTELRIDAGWGAH